MYVLVSAAGINMSSCGSLLPSHLKSLQRVTHYFPSLAFFFSTLIALVCAFNEVYEVYMMAITKRSVSWFPIGCGDESISIYRIASAHGSSLVK
jgi:hypothetical protein